MAAPKKKVVTKDDLRRLMKEKQSLTKDLSKKVNHPLAKYNSLNQLVCMLCNNVIKSDLLWISHIQSKQHKEKATAVKTQGPAKPEYLSNVTVKRKGNEDVDVIYGKRQKTEATVLSNRSPTDTKDPDPRTTSNDDVRERAKAAFLAGYSSSSSSADSDSEDDEEAEGGKLKSDSNTSTPMKNSLPKDFFDSEEVASNKAKPETSSSHNKKMAEILPEGFFDDPKLDAKVREVVYKDKEEVEWELFQKAIKEEAHVSEVIMEEEDEQVNIDRNIDEIDDQIQRWQEVESLHVKKETILKNSKTDSQKNKDAGDDVDEEELDDFLDWRAKKLLK